jgi:hypothetical protein
MSTRDVIAVFLFVTVPLLAIAVAGYGVIRGWW